MDDFFDDLEKTLSVIDSDVVWKRQIGNLNIWFAPMQYDGSVKLNEVYGNPELGTNMVSEAKRTTLAHTIVGFGDTDLRPHRNSFSFKKKGRDGKYVKCSLDAYLYEKIASWPSQFVDDSFEVYADLNESYQKRNLMAVEFENKKTPRELLAEYESKVAELRSQLGMLPLVEAQESIDETDETGSEEVQRVMEEVRPFDRVFTPSSGPNASTLPPPSIPDPTAQTTPTLTLEEQMEEEIRIASSRSNRGPLQTSASGASSNESPYRPHTTSVVAETRAPELPKTPPQFDQVVPTANVNPRFARPVR